ncbi:MAG TPA: transcription termination/antitermination protein NusG [Gammaproteobacteria bacterium]|nr:transcription termination/antitermination protein NusG [Gammaproteobacteria bacterium]
MSDLESSSTKQWYVVHTRTGEENAVVLRLQDRMRSQHLEDKFGEIVVPTEEVVEMRSGQKRKTERKFFPGYVWVEMIMDAQTWHFIKEIPGVIGFIGGKNPAPIPASQANSILRRVQEGANKPRPKILFEPGEVVRVIEGPFADFNGVVEDVNYEKNRLRVSVLIFGRSTPVELEFGQVEKT